MNLPFRWFTARTQSGQVAAIFSGMPSSVFTWAAALGVNEPAPKEMIGALAALPLPGLEDGPGALPGSGGLDPLQNRLFEEHQIEVPVFAWPGAGRRLIRIAAQRYNQMADYEKLARALEQLK